MILNPVSLPESNNMENFDNFRHEWSSYYEQYKNAFLYLIRDAENKRYSTNRISLPFLFLLRHTFELKLKKTIFDNGHRVINTHKLLKLIDDSSLTYTEEFLNSIKLLDPLYAASFFRYYTNPKDETYADYIEKSFGTTQVELLPLCNFLLNHENQELLSVTDKRLIWELTFHLSECMTKEQVATQYDFLITKLIKGINESELSLENVFLPLLFLIRHSVEVKLKCTLDDILIIDEEFFNDDEVTIIKRNHNVLDLFILFERFINHQITQFSSENEELKEIMESDNRDLSELIRLLTSIDSNSIQTRYPLPLTESSVDINYQLLKSLYDLYLKTDSYLCFGIKNLIVEGLINPSIDVLIELGNSD